MNTKLEGVYPKTLNDLKDQIRLSMEQQRCVICGTILDMDDIKEVLDNKENWYKLEIFKAC